MSFGPKIWIFQTFLVSWGFICFQTIYFKELKLMRKLQFWHFFLVQTKPKWTKNSNNYICALYIERPWTTQGEENQVRHKLINRRRNYKMCWNLRSTPCTSKQARRFCRPDISSFELTNIWTKKINKSFESSQTIYVHTILGDPGQLKMRKIK